MLFGLFVAFCLFIAVFAKVHNPADGRHRIGSDFDEVNAIGTGNIQGLPQRNYTELFALQPNDPDLAGTDFPIYPDEWTGGRRRTWRKGAAQDTPTS